MNGEVAGGVNSGSPANRYRNAAIASRDTASDGRNCAPAGVSHPVLIPASASHWISVLNWCVGGTSMNVVPGAAGTATAALVASWEAYPVFDPVTRTFSEVPASAGCTAYVALVAPSMGASSRSHW